MLLDAVQLQKILPHRYPFLFIDRVLAATPNESIVAQKLVSVGDPILQGHFPGFPILPGVVQVEAMAQAAVVLANLSGVFDPALHNCFFMGIQEAKFRGPVVPGDVLTIEVKAQRMGRIGKFSGETRVGEQVKSSGVFTAIIEPKRSDAGGAA
ncbi:3-hydroxyacyl-ACP dehydratase FabZ [Nannocystis radixulma]|uniref:3-hydroxyacyl-ACP dehydratase FabZ n=1 Tax=Nannocystis radixulma TaxID=2995305 RepID=A0ABT5BKU6_9BACT|nr:3-hydroxyacyl-ACP dehydratase FabZ [Nannocystis radixulma]MDC0674048.1 3-hydroxyacyl-ACP dehydratase FabZ [Nannocystis radixulma]